MCTSEYTVRENVPVNLGSYSMFKNGLTYFFSRPLVVKMLAQLPDCFFRSTVKIANLIIRCQVFFKNSDLCIARMTMYSTVHGGDHLDTLEHWGNRVDPISRSNSLKNRKLTLRILNEDCLTAARKIRSSLEDKKEEIAILCFSNRWQKADVAFVPCKESQEGFLARHSNLAIDTDYHKIRQELSVIREAEGYTPKEKLTHYIPYFGTVFTKGVTFIVEPDDVANPKNFDQFNIISASAPDMRPGSDESIFFKNHASKNKDAQSIQYEVVKNKIQAIFNTAIIERNKHIVLGAFGCGIFKNEAEIVARIFKLVLNQPRYKDWFETIYFAINCEEKRNIFEKVFKN